MVLTYCWGTREGRGNIGGADLGAGHGSDNIPVQSSDEKDLLAVILRPNQDLENIHRDWT